jgi:hypothetical protein
MEKQGFIFLVFSLAVCGCGRKETESAKPQPAESRRSVSIESLANSQPAAPAAPSAPSTPVSPTAPDAPPDPEAPAGPEATDPVIAAYNRELAAWILSRDYVPTDLNDLKNREGLPALPKAPLGKKIVYVPDQNLPTKSKIILQ